MGCCGFQGSSRIPEVVPAPTPASEVVLRHRARAEVALVDATAGAPICRIDGHAPAGVRGAKVAEGRLTAVRELQRALRREPGAEPLGAARRLLETWTAEQGRAATRGEAWAAYRDGGVAALRSLIGDLDSLRSRTAGEA